MLLNFLTGYHFKGVLILDKKRIFFNYLKSWFIIDFLSCFPYSIIELTSEDFNSTPGLISTKLLRVLR